jgi:hypothetical protein
MFVVGYEEGGIIKGKSYRLVLNAYVNQQFFSYVRLSY